MMVPVLTHRAYARGYLNPTCDRGANEGVRVSHKDEQGAQEERPGYYL